MTRVKKSKKTAADILDAAMELFCEKSIDDTTIEEIAEKAGVGSATVYRYFENKAGVAIEGAAEYWAKVAARYINVSHTAGYEDLTGKEQLELILDGLVGLFENETGFLKYLQEFEVFVRRYNIEIEKLKSYENAITDLKPGVMKALEKGLADGTLAFEWTPNEVCYSLAHTVFGLMKRFAWNGSMLGLDGQVSLVLQVKIAIKLLMKGLSA